MRHSVCTNVCCNGDIFLLPHASLHLLSNDRSCFFSIAKSWYFVTMPATKVTTTTGYGRKKRKGKKGGYSGGGRPRKVSSDCELSITRAERRTEVGVV